MVPNEIRGQLADLGFRKTRIGGYRRGKFKLGWADGWATLTDERKQRSADVLEGELGKAGSWKRVFEYGSSQRLVELPPAVFAAEHPLDADNNRDRGSRPVVACLRWAIETANGDRPAYWKPPPREEVNEWTSKGCLSVRAGPSIRQIILTHAPGRLALSVPIVPLIPVDLPDERAAWLRKLLVETQNRWRMVRVGLVPNGDQQSALAEVDLSGAPHPFLESLFVTGLSALRYAVKWSVQSADLLADLSVNCDVCGVRQPVF